MNQNDHILFEGEHHSFFSRIKKSLLRILIISSIYIFLAYIFNPVSFFLKVILCYFIVLSLGIYFNWKLRKYEITYFNFEDDIITINWYEFNTFYTIRMNKQEIRIRLIKNGVNNTIFVVRQKENRKDIVKQLENKEWTKEKMEEIQKAIEGKVLYY